MSDLNNKTNNYVDSELNKESLFDSNKLYISAKSTIDSCTYCTCTERYDNESYITKSEQKKSKCRVCNKNFIYQDKIKNVPLYKDYMETHPMPIEGSEDLCSECSKQISEKMLGTKVEMVTIPKTQFFDFLMNLKLYIGQQSKPDNVTKNSMPNKPQYISELNRSIDELISSTTLMKHKLGLTISDLTLDIIYG